MKSGNIMFANYLKKIFFSRDHKDIMLKGLYISSIVIFLFLGIVSGLMGYKTVLWVKLSIVIFISILFYSYLKNDKLQLHAILLIIVVELDSAYVLLDQHFNNFVTIYPFFIIFGFFFFFKLRTAVWLTLGHLVYWLVISEYGHVFFPDDPTFQAISLANIAVCSVIATVFAYFYYVSTEMSYEKLENANRQKEILLKEIHHRIKNNLNKTSSLIGLQMMNVENGKEKDVTEVLRKSKLRIEAMAMVHDELYRTDDIEKINFESYIKNLTQRIKQSYGRHIPVKVSSADIYLSLDVMMKIGLIINELLTNSIKHTCSDDEVDVKLEIILEKRENKCILTYKQYSKESVDLDTLETTETLGMKLIRLTVKEMDGEIDVSNGPGLQFNIHFMC